MGAPVALLPNCFGIADRCRGAHGRRDGRWNQPVEWPQQIVLIGVYAVAALWALLLAYSASRRFFALRRFRSMGRLEPFAFTAVDVLILTGFQLLSTDGIYPLLIMILLPVLVGLDVSTRRAAVVLACTLVGFAVAVLGDPVMLRAIGWPRQYFGSRSMRSCAPRP